MRHFVTVDANWYTCNGGDRLHAIATANLRLLAVQTGFDFRGTKLSGRMVVGAPGLDIVGLGDRLELADERAAILTRAVVSENALPDQVIDERFDLFVAISAGERFGWSRGTANAAATVTIDRANRLHKVETTIVDVLQDIMVANSDLVQEIVRRYSAASGGPRGFYQEKAAFARDWHERNRSRPTLIESYEPDGYSAFSTLVRGRSPHTYEISADQASTLGTLWRKFLVERMAAHFMDASAATTFVVNGRSRRLPGRSKQKAMISRGDLSRDDLLALFGDKQVVGCDDCYVLLICDDRSQDMIDAKAALFGWKDARRKIVRQLRLIRHEDYARALDLVRKEQVTPVVLFLKKPV